jgi:hypothetical protein
LEEIMTETVYPEIVAMLKQRGDPTSLCAVRCIEELCDLLLEALESVDADEQSRRESWPKEVERGELILDLSDRICQALGIEGQQE